MMKKFVMILVVLLMVSNAYGQKTQIQSQELMDYNTWVTGAFLSTFVGYGVGLFVQGQSGAGAGCLMGQLVGTALMIKSAVELSNNPTNYDDSKRIF